MSDIVPCRRLLKAFLSLFPFLFIMGCVTTGSDGTTRSIIQNPELMVSANWRHNGSEDSSAVTSRIEQSFIEAFPNSKITGVKSSPDYIVDVTVFSKSVKESPFVSESRKCLRYSDPDPNEKNFFKKMLTVKCLNWGTERKNCTQKIYDLGVEIRGKDSLDQLVFIGWESFTDEVNLCSTPDTSDLKNFSELEGKAASWALGLFSKKIAARSIQKVQPANSTQATNSPTGSKNSVGAQETQDLKTEAIASKHRVKKAHALVIGNSSYIGSGRLKNPKNDASDVGNALSQMGFQVRYLLDGSRSDLVSTLVAFQNEASASDITLMYYAGHGVQIDGVNYVIPVDMNLNDFSQIPLQAISLNSIVDQYLPGKAKLVFLDACRDNPLLYAKSRSIRRGLAPINAPEGTLISYATKDGFTAQDGEGRNSPYTSALLEHLGDQEDIAVVLRKVREKVMERTAGQQQPWEYGSMTGGALVLSTIKK